ncbi:MAG: N-acetyltransferase [Dehalococcoidales bacterium]|nr:N-acetyltransferase [Dehalococcoidales bacterium]
MEYKVEKARIGDVGKIHKMVNHFAANGQMLPRSLSEIYENIRDYFVVRENDEVVACVALHVNWEDLAEVKSIAVTEEYQKHGVGEKLVESCLDEAKELGIPTVFCLTYVPDFFVKCGFELVDKKELPHKVWGECYRCRKFPDCDESALWYHMGERE